MLGFIQHCPICPEFVGNQLELHWHVCKAHSKEKAKFSQKPILTVNGVAYTYYELMARQHRVLFKSGGESAGLAKTVSCRRHKMAVLE